MRSFEKIERFELEKNALKNVVYATVGRSIEPQITIVPDVYLRVFAR